MKTIHIECNPDEILAKSLGFTKQNIIHHSGKYRILSTLKVKSKQLAIVDDDPGKSRHPYEHKLQTYEEQNRIKILIDIERQNLIAAICPRFEEWLVESCRESKINIQTFGLPNKSDELHKVINKRELQLNKLLNELIKKKNKSFIFLKETLTINPQRSIDKKH